MMNYKIEVRKNKQNKKIHRILKSLNIMYVKSEEKVAYYYENINRKITFSFNENITFYAASTIKIIVALYLYDNKIDLSKTLNIDIKDVKQGCGIIKIQELPRDYSIKELVMNSLKYSDNTAYLKLVEWIGKEELIKYGKSLNAEYTLQGKDNFGIINCKDLTKYWNKLWELQERYPELREWLETPEYSIIDSKNVEYNKFLRKYGAYDIAYHECGIVCAKEPFYLFILTQKGKNEKARKFINKTAKQLMKVHKELIKIRGNDN